MVDKRMSRQKHANKLIVWNLIDVVIWEDSSTASHPPFSRVGMQFVSLINKMHPKRLIGVKLHNNSPESLPPSLQYVIRDSNYMLRIDMVAVNEMCSKLYWRGVGGNLLLRQEMRTTTRTAKTRSTLSLHLHRSLRVTFKIARVSSVRSLVIFMALFFK